MDFMWILKIISITAHVSKWSQKALEDNKVTLLEAAELAQGVCDILGIPVEVEIPDDFNLSLSTTRTDDEGGD